MTGRACEAQQTSASSALAWRRLQSSPGRALVIASSRTQSSQVRPPPARACSDPQYICDVCAVCTTRVQAHCWPPAETLITRGSRARAARITAGVAAGLGSRAVTHPFDTLKARAQVRGAIGEGAERTRGAANLWASARSLIRSEGAFGFYRGFGAVAGGAVPAQAAYFAGYEFGKRTVPEDAGIAGDMATGCIAQVIAGVAFTPVDILKERLQVRLCRTSSAWSFETRLHLLRALHSCCRMHRCPSGCFDAVKVVSPSATHWDCAHECWAGACAQDTARLRSVQVHTLLSRAGVQSTASLSDTLRRIWRADGIGGLLRGYWATNCVWLPWNIVYIASYEGLRKQARLALGIPSQEALPAHVTAAAALTAASGAVIVTHPPDVIKTRLQVCSSAGGPCTAACAFRGLPHTLKRSRHADTPHARVLYISMLRAGDVHRVRNSTRLLCHS